MLQKLSFLKNKMIAYIAIGVIGLLDLISSICTWADIAFSLDSLISLILILAIFVGLCLSIKKDNKMASYVLAGAYLFMVGFNFLRSGCADAGLDPEFFDGTFIAHGVFILLFGLCLLTSFVLMVLRFFMGGKSIFGTIHFFACLGGLLFAFVALIILFIMKPGAAAIFSGFEIFLLPAAVLIVSSNLPDEKAEA